MSSRGEGGGKSNCPQEKEVCLIPPQTKMVAKIPAFFSISEFTDSVFDVSPNPAPTGQPLGNGRDLLLGERHLPKGRRGVRGTSTGGIWSRVARWI